MLAHLKWLWRKWFGDPYAFRRVDHPDTPEHLLPKRLQDVDRVSEEKRRFNRES